MGCLKMTNVASQQRLHCSAAFPAHQQHTPRQRVAARLSCGRAQLLPSTSLSTALRDENSRSTRRDATPANFTYCSRRPGGQADGRTDGRGDDDRTRHVTAPVRS